MISRGIGAVEYEIGCGRCRTPLVLEDDEPYCSRCMAHPGSTVRQTGRKRRRQFVAWLRSRRVPLPLKPVEFR